MLPGETLPLFLHDLKRLLDQAMPESIPQWSSTINKQLRSTGETQWLETTVE